MKSNPALSLDFVHRPKVEVKRLSHLTVERMFRHAQERDIELIPPYTIGFLCGLREAELWRLQYSNIVISESEKHVIVPAAISKVKKKRIIPLSDNAISWMQWYFHHARRDILPEGDELLMSKWYPNKLRAHRQANYEAAAGEGAKWPQNCKRHAFASHYAAAYPDKLEYLAIKLMGHTGTDLTYQRYAGAVTHEAGLAFFQIKP